MAHLRPDQADRVTVGNVDDLEPLARRGDRDFDTEFKRAVAAFNVRETQHRASRDMWLAHHWHDEYDRCVVVGRRHVCRRCLILYPLALLVAAASLAGQPPWPETLDLWLIWGLCIPATVDFVAEQIGVVRYSATRQTIVTLLMAPALGQGFAHELDDSWSWEFWGPVLVFCTLWFVAATAFRTRGDDPARGRAERHHG
jgi:hypothetical protein